MLPGWEKSTPDPEGKVYYENKARHIKWDEAPTMVGNNLEDGREDFGPGANSCQNHEQCLIRVCFNRGCSKCGSVICGECWDAGNKRVMAGKISPDERCKHCRHFRSLKVNDRIRGIRTVKASEPWRQERADEQRIPAGNEEFGFVCEVDESAGKVWVIFDGDDRKLLSTLVDPSKYEDKETGRIVVDVKSLKLVKKGDPGWKSLEREIQQDDRVIITKKVIFKKDTISAGAKGKVTRVKTGDYPFIVTLDDFPAERLPFHLGQLRKDEARMKEPSLEAPQETQREAAASDVLEGREARFRAAVEPKCEGLQT